MKRFVRLPDVVESTGLKVSTIYEGMRDGWFPRSIQIGPRAVAWNVEEIETWQQDRIAKRESAAA